MMNLLPTCTPFAAMPKIVFLPIIDASWRSEVGADCAFTVGINSFLYGPAGACNFKEIAPVPGTQQSGRRAVHFTGRWGPLVCPQPLVAPASRHCQNRSRLPYPNSADSH